MLVCGRNPGDFLGFRCQVHGYVDVPQKIARDKQDYCDNILPLMDYSLAYVTRNTLVGVGNTQYPEGLLRETVNNALAHRDYAINKQVIISIKPGLQISIQNPGTFRKHLLLDTQQEPKLHRILPEAKPRNPKLADVLRVYRMWEGKGYGMATLVNLCLENKIDLPYYRLLSEEVNLIIRAGKLLDEKMERLFASFDAYLARKLNGLEPSESQKLVLAYLIKSEWDNEHYRHTILLTPDNNHFSELRTLENAGLIALHPESRQYAPVYIVDRELMKRDYLSELRAMFGLTFDTLDNFAKEILQVLYRHNRYSRIQQVSAKQASFYLWAEQERAGGDIKAFDQYYRKVRNMFNRLEQAEYIIKQEKGRGYRLNEQYLADHLT